jgi:hypothetical protein
LAVGGAGAVAVSMGFGATAVAVAGAVHVGRVDVAWGFCGAMVIPGEIEAVALAAGVTAAVAGEDDATADAAGATEAVGPADALADALGPADTSGAADAVARVLGAVVVAVEGATVRAGAACGGASGVDLPSHQPRPKVSTMAPATIKASSPPRLLGSGASSNVGNVGSCRR